MIGKTVALLQIPNQRLFNTKAAAQYLGICPDTLRKYSDLGIVQPRRLGKCRAFILEDLNVFIESLPEYHSCDNSVGGGKPGRKEINDGN